MSVSLTPCPRDNCTGTLRALLTRDGSAVEGEVCGTCAATWMHSYPKPVPSAPRHDAGTGDHPAPMEATAPAEDICPNCGPVPPWEVASFPDHPFRQHVKCRSWTGSLVAAPPVASPPPSPGGERPHIVNGQFQSDKYPTCPPGKVPLSVRDATAQDLLWVYAQRRRSVDAQFAADLEWALRQAGYAAPSPGGEDGTVGRFLAFAACQSDDTDRAICDAFYRAFVRLEQQLDDTQRRLQATEDSRQRVCFARDRFAEQLEEIIKRDNEEAVRIERIASGLIGRLVPEQTSAKNLTVIEEGVYALRQRIDRLEAEREPVADCAGEADVEDLIDACAGLTERGPEWDLWARRHLTAKALHDAWQQERSRRVLAEEDAERWHRLFDEGATLTASKDASLAAASDRYARAVADADAVRERLAARVAELEAAARGKGAT